MKLKPVLEYPKLKSQGGAFELMRAEGGGNSRPVCLIPMPADGYSVPYLKEVMSGTTMMYIRPIKGSLSLEKAELSTSADTPLTECTNCQKQVSILNLRQHYEECKPVTIDVNEKSSILNDDVEVLVDSEVPNEDKVPNEKTACNRSNVDTLLNWQSQPRSAFHDAKDDDIEEITSRALTAGFLPFKTSFSPEDTALLDVEDLVEMFVRD